MDDVSVVVVAGRENRALRPRPSALAECPPDAGQWLRGISGHFLGKLREIPCLFAQLFDLFARERGRQLEKL